MSRTSVRTAETPDGRRAEVARIVDAPAAVVWDVLVDTARWPEWGPSVGDVESPDRYIRRGTAGRVRVAGVWVPFRVTACDEYRWTWEVGGISATGHRVEPLGERRCRLAFEIPLVAAPYAVVCARAARTISRLAARE